MIFRLIGPVTLVGVIVVGACPADCTNADEIVSVEVQNTTDRPLVDVPVTFGQAFKRGDVPRGMRVHCPVGDGWAQVDRKRTYDDGSLRFAVISAIVPKLAAGGSETLRLTADKPRHDAELKPRAMGDPLDAGFNAEVTLTLPDGTVLSANVLRLFERSYPQPNIWLHGHVASETSLDESLDEDLNVQFQVRFYAGGRRVRVSVVVENCWDDSQSMSYLTRPDNTPLWAGNIRYDAKVTVGGKTVLAEKAVDHRRLSRWRRVFWWGDGKPEVHIVHDLAYLSATGALPNYDRRVQPAETPDWRQKQLRLKGPDWRIMGKGALTAYMPTTGGRPEIAPYPAWTVRYLLGMDPQAKALVLASGEQAGSWPIHVRVRGSGRIMTIDDRPKFWLDARGEDRPKWKPDRHPPGPDYVKLTPDLAHQGSFAYVPYLVTGDYYYLEEAYFWANHCLLATWPHPRREAEGILAGQIRGNAWSLRNMADAAWIAPDDDPEKAYFDTKIRNNLTDRIRRMIGPPEHSKLGFWGERSTLNARIQNPANPQWMVIAPWEHDYLMWSLHHLDQLGWSDAAKVRDYLLRWRIGTLTNAPDFDPRLATPYRFVVGEQAAGGKVVFYEDWKTVGRENARLTKPQPPGKANDYAYSARAAIICAVDAGFPGAREALKTLEAQFSDLPDQMSRNPTWAIAPRTQAGKSRR
ncbi:MAG: hypothetical protein HQ567_08350 [Candidatus Nealsonbacteria bacterium]|nr:hypothetical protein [Candidatus Nealsonbacteria bacterium]